MRGGAAVVTAGHARRGRPPRGRFEVTDARRRVHDNEEEETVATEAEELPAPECADARSSEDSKGASHRRLARMRSVTKRAEQLCACTQPTSDKSSAAAHAGGDAIAVRENKYRPTSARIA